MPPPCDVDPDGRSPAVRGPAVTGSRPTVMSFTVAAHPTAAWLSRARFRSWLADLGFPAEWTEDLVYVISEAVSNAAEHAYPQDVTDGVVAIEAEAVRDGGADLWRVRVRVVDTGSWKAVNPEQEHRGHGLAAIAALAAEVTIRRGDAESPFGTEVILVSRAAARRAPVEPSAERSS